MSAHLEVFRQNNILIALAVLVVGGAVFLWYRGLGFRWWKLWACYSLVAGGLLLFLRTPAATLTDHYVPRDLEGRDSAAGPVANTFAPNWWQAKKFEPQSVAEIRDLLRTGGKPTLVEVYSDYGLS